MGKYEYFEHQADVGIIGCGATLEEAFIEGAKAMFQVMADIKNIEAKREIKIEAEANDEETLFVEWLNALLSHKDIDDMLFSEFKLKIKKEQNTFKLKGTAKGETTDYDKHHLKTEVKAATYSQLKVEILNKQYKVQCVVDV